jgi:hypothetical protein
VGLEFELTQDFVLAKQALYGLSHTSSPFWWMEILRQSPQIQAEEMGVGWG